ncbi:hypothetical protein SDC9_14716 [bioreactor metagenome]|uniref:Uncharacterized protein n=1 Tax=bioreactor metagenome TaxID=1076179 RepID=A0A644TPW1_9ZZZZ
MATEITMVYSQTKVACNELIAAACLKAGQIIVVGCSTSEVRGARIGSAGSDEVAGAILDALRETAAEAGVMLAIQCCEHLNRALVVERELMERYNFEQVAVVPVPKAGGALAARAMRTFADPVVVETMAAHAGLDIGSTLIGMHLKRVAVPLRLAQKFIGQATVTAATTRPKLIGGARAIYELPELKQMN